MSFFVLGNWKSNGDRDMVNGFAEDFTPVTTNGLTCGIAPPLHLGILAQDRFLNKLSFGAQNVSATDAGAYTGEVTAKMLTQIGVEFCLVGHSERRHYYGETVASTKAKAERLLEAGILPIFCIGETLVERGAGQLEEVLSSQLAPFAELPKDANYVVAYEPVWAIGTGVAANVADVAGAHKLVKRLLAKMGFQQTPVLYGGSVKPANAAELGALEQVDGFLVGGASLKAADFNAIVAGFVSAKNL